MTNEQPFTPDWFSKPGDSLLALMQRRNLTAGQLAAALEGGMDVLRGLLAGSIAIDVPRARALVSVLGGTTNFWLSWQANYERDLNRAVDVVFEFRGRGVA